MDVRLYIKDLVYGANDGIITTFAIVAGVVGAGLSVRAVLIIGFASLLADGFSMAASSYLGGRSERAAFANAKMDMGDSSFNKNPLVSGLFTFVAFIGAGLFPLLPYLFVMEEAKLFLYAAIATAAALFIIGALRTLVTGRHFIVAGIEMLIIGGIAAVIAYMTGYFVSTLF
ncbi:MAG: hypothetical protein BMS9Abin13_289 [Patescibacteria group bacterium]|nr:MAG: hypothetical protein BMS9Abin13_289 [Patescibacteria group bacterium]